MKAKNLFVRGSVLAVSLSAAIAAQAADVQWLQTGQQDLSATQLVRSADAAPLSPNANRNVELVQFQWPLEADATLASGDEGSVNESRQYWLDVDAVQLSKGVAINTSSTGAVIRVSPMNANSRATLKREELSLSVGGRALDANASFSTFANSSQLRASGAPFAEGTIAFQLNGNVPAGEITLALNNRAASSDQYVIHVFEPNSKAIAEVRTAKSAHLVGSPINASLKVDGAQGQVSGFLVSPDGKTSIDLSFQAGRDGYSASVNAPAFQGNGLWELHTHFDGVNKAGQRILRDTKTAVNITAATARLNQQAQIQQSFGSAQGQVALNLGVDVAAAGRYQLSGVIYGTNKSGQLQPVALAQSAKWLEAGSQQLPLSFNVSVDGISAPYEVRDLRLQDQSRLGVLHRQDRALLIR